MKSLTIALATVFILLFLGCSNDNDWPIDESTSASEEGDGSTEVPEISVVDPDNEEDYVENSTFDSTVRITFSAGSAAIENSTDGVSVDQSAAGVTVTSTVKGVEYIVSGTTANGFLKVYSDYKFKLTLNGASITNTKGPAINIQSGKRCYVVLNKGTTSALTDGSGYSTAPDGEDQKGCFFSEGKILFSGAGSLTVEGNYSHGVCSDDYIRMLEGSITVSKTVKDGIHANDAFIMDGGTLSVNSSSDGIECEKGYIYIRGGSMIVNPGDDGIVASFEGTDTSVNPTIYISGGDISVNSTAQKGQGIKSTGDVSISGTGTYTIKTTGPAAKGINAGGNVVVTGGTTVITTTGTAIVENGDTSSAAGIKTGGDFGMKSGTLTIKSSGKGGKGINADGNFVLEDGSLSVTTSGTKFSSGSYSSQPKGIKSGVNATIHGGTCLVDAQHEGIETEYLLTVNGGIVEVKAVDDALNVSNSKGVVTINGGYVYCYSSANDAIDSNGRNSSGSIIINGGIVIANGGGSAEEAFDCDNYPFLINGGVVIGTGGQNQSTLSGSSKQYSVAYGGSASLNQYVALTGSSGETILTYCMPKTYSSMRMILSHPDLAKGSYAIVKGGTYSGGTEIFNGYYTGGTYSGGTSTSFTISSIYTSVGSTSTGGGPRM